MAKPNQHIADYLHEYRRMADTDFAILIAGPWGCGKTFFIRSCFNSDELIYVSLNGVTDLSQIEVEIFKAIYPVVKWKPLGVFGRICTEALKAKYSFNLAETIKLSDFKAKIGERVLVVDDLERCLLTSEEILGYINSYVESRTKVIVIGEEDFLNQQSSEKFRRIKEKVVGKTFRMAECVGSVFDDLVTQQRYPITHSLLRRNRETIMGVFRNVSKATNQCNYRALKHCFGDFELFFTNIEKCFRDTAQFVDALLAVFIALDYEVQLANLTADDIARGPADDKDEDGQKTESKYAAVLKRHGLQDSDFMPAFSTVVLQRETWVTIFHNAVVDKQVLTETIRNSKYFPQNQPEWVVLWHWRNLDDDIAADALAKVRDKLKAFAYCTREEILHVYSILTGLSGLNAISETKEALVSDLSRYLNVLLAQKRLVIPPYGWRDVSMSGSHGLGYWQEDSKEDFPRLVAVIRKAVEKAVCKDTEDSVSVWLSQVGEFPGQFYPKLEMNAEFSRQPVLHLFQPAQFLDEFVKIANETKWAVQNLLIKRFVTCDAPLAAELPFLEGIVQELDKRLAVHKGNATPTIANLTYFRDQMKAILPDFQKMVSGLASSPTATITGALT